MRNIDEIIAQNILSRIDERQISQKELAKKAKISYEGLNKVLNGKRRAGRNLLAIIAKELGCSVEDLHKDPAAIETQWETMSQRDMAKAMLSMSEEIDRLKEEIAVLSFGAKSDARKSLAKYLLTGDEKYWLEIEHKMEGKKAAHLKNHLFRTLEELLGESP